MTLERHRSHLIPEVGYGLDGTLMVTDTGGTFPLRGKGQSHKDIRDLGYGSPPPPPQSYRSYDPRRDDDRKRKFKQRPSPNYTSKELQNMTGYSTISTHTSSLVRRLRRSKRKYSSVRGQEYRYHGGNNNYIGDDFKFKANGHGSMSAGSTGRRLRAGTPRMTPEFAETLRKKKSARSLDFGGSRRESPYDLKRRASMDRKAFQKERKSSNGSIKSFPVNNRLRKIHDEKLPYVVFLVDGVFLILAGIVRFVMSYWHEYYCSLWAGILAMILGIVGAKHNGLYLAKNLNAGYVFMALVVSIAMLASSAFVLDVFVPSITLLANDASPEDIISMVKTTNMNKTLTSVQLSTSAVVWTSVALDIISLLFIFVGLFSLTAALIALSNHWDAAYDTTDDCDHRGNPRLFNPIEQAALGEATVLVGLLYVSAEAAYSHIDHGHFYLPVLAGALVIISGILSFCFGKRTDLLALGTFACILELLSFAACCGATVLITLGIVDDVVKLQGLSDNERGGQKNKELVAITVIGGALIFVMAVNIIFVVGTVFRHFRQVCCRNCCEDKPPARRDRFGSIDRRDILKR